MARQMTQGHVWLDETCATQHRLQRFQYNRESGRSDKICFRENFYLSGFYFRKRVSKFPLLTASIKPFKDGVLSIRASKTSSDSFRTYSSTNSQPGVQQGGERKDVVIHMSKIRDSGERLK